MLKVGRAEYSGALQCHSPVRFRRHLAGAVEIIRDISRLKALEQEKEDFVSMLSHDLKTPITAIVGSLDLVREGRLGPSTRNSGHFWKPHWRAARRWSR